MHRVGGEERVERKEEEGKRRWGEELGGTRWSRQGKDRDNL